MHRALRGPARTAPGRAPFVHVAGVVLTLALLGAPVGGCAQTHDTRFTGDWSGALDVPGRTLRIAFHVERTDTAYTATLDSPDQGAFGIRVGSVQAVGDTLRLLLPALTARYEGVLDGDTIRGAWTQGGASFDLDIGRMTEPLETGKPQDPTPPYPYDTVAVRIPNPGAGIELAGTLTVPDGDGPFPAALLISGSGPQDRDEFLMGHRPFLVLADYLTRQGVSVLRLDDRGVSGSTGDFATATTEDFAADMTAAVRWLEARPETDPAAVGLIGHSEGGLVAPRVSNAADRAGRDDLVDWMVLLAGPGIPGDSLIRLQMARILEAGGMPEDRVARRVAQQKALQEAVRTAESDAEAVRRIDAALRDAIADLTPAERARSGITTPVQLDSMIARSTRQLLSPWYRYFMAYDPRPDLRALDTPTLALFGSLDLQVPAPENAAALREAFQASDAPRWDVRVLPGLNHLFQHAETGTPDEYSRIEETFAPEAMDAIAGWIREVSGR